MSASIVKRTASREQRREQLVVATMKCIARKGMSSTTLGDVAKEAGLSQGIVNLHFKSKDNLLKETLHQLADEYKRKFTKALEKSGPDAAEQLRSVLLLNLRPSIIDRQKIAVWFAFWGEVKSHPTYRKICDERDRFYDSAIVDLCGKIIAEGKYDNLSPATVALSLTSMTDGMWLSALINPRAFDRNVAADAIEEMLRNFFPRHFS